MTPETCNRISFSLYTLTIILELTGRHTIVFIKPDYNSIIASTWGSKSRYLVGINGGTIVRRMISFTPQVHTSSLANAKKMETLM